VGSSDLDNWVQEARNSTISFLKNHVEQPVNFSMIYQGFHYSFIFFVLNKGELDLKYPYEIGAVVSIVKFA